MAEIFKQDIVLVENTIQTPTRREKHSTIIAASTLTTSPSTPSLDFSSTPFTTGEDSSTPPTPKTPTRSSNEHNALKVFRGISVVENTSVTPTLPAGRVNSDRRTTSRRQKTHPAKKASDESHDLRTVSVPGNCQQSIFKYTQVSVKKTTDNQPNVELNFKQINTNFRELEAEDIFHRAGRSIISELRQSIGGSTDLSFEAVGTSEATTRVAKLIKSFVIENGPELARYLPRIAPSTESSGYNLNGARSLQELGRYRETVAKSLSWTNKERYCMILPVDLVNRLNEGEGRCVHDKLTKPKGQSRRNKQLDVSEADEGQRCKRKIKSLKDETRPLLRRLASLLESCDFSNIAGVLGYVIDKACCNQDHRSKAKFVLDLLCQRLAQSPHNGDSAKDLEERRVLQDWLISLTSPLIDPVCKIDEHIPAQNARVTPKTSGSSNRGTRKVGKAKICAAPAKDLAPPSPTPFEFLLLLEESDSVKIKNLNLVKASTSTHLNHKNFESYVSPNKETLEDVIRTPLTPGDRERVGIIYIYWHVGSFCYVKIGRAEKVSDRLESWKAKCGFDLLEHKDKLAFPREVRHPHRVEKLIHTQLEEYRFKEPECAGCRQAHDEWFKVSSNFAQNVVSKWTRWMQDEDPYDREGNFKAATCTTRPETTAGEEMPRTRHKKSHIQSTVHGTVRLTRSKHKDILAHNPWALDAVLLPGI